MIWIQLKQDYEAGRREETVKFVFKLDKMNTNMYIVTSWLFTKIGIVALSLNQSVKIM